MLASTQNCKPRRGQCTHCANQEQQKLEVDEYLEHFHICFKNSAVAGSTPAQVLPRRLLISKDVEGLSEHSSSIGMQGRCNFMRCMMAFTGVNYAVFVEL
eukprot:s3745_g12.t1